MSNTVTSLIKQNVLYCPELDVIAVDTLENGKLFSRDFGYEQKLKYKTYIRNSKNFSYTFIKIGEFL